MVSAVSHKLNKLRGIMILAERVFTTLKKISKPLFAGVESSAWWGIRSLFNLLVRDQGQDVVSSYVKLKGLFCLVKYDLRSMDSWTTTATEILSCNQTLLPAFTSGSIDDLYSSFDFVDVCKLSLSSTTVQSPMWKGGAQLPSYQQLYRVYPFSVGVVDF